jgi:hypothetical protein
MKFNILFLGSDKILFFVDLDSKSIADILGDEATIKVREFDADEEDPPIPIMPP